MIRFWVIKWRGHGPVLVVKYEDLLEDWRAQVMRMLSFLNVEARDFVDWSAGFLQYQRAHRQPYSHYTMEQVAVVNRAIMETHEYLRDAGVLDMLSVIEYYWNNSHLSLQ